MNKQVQLVLLLCLGLLSTASTLLLSSPTAFAANSSKNLKVVVAMDVTSQSSCFDTTVINANTRSQTTFHSACEAGSIIKSEVLYLSEALAQGKKYVLLPPHSAPITTWKQITLQIQDLIVTEWHYIKQSLKKTKSLLIKPLNLVRTQYWTAGGTSLASKVNFYPTSDSGTGVPQVIVSSAEVDGTGTRNTVLWWDHDQVQASNIGTGYPQIPRSGSLVQGRYKQAAAGSYYENWVKDNDCQWFYGTFWHNDISLS